MKKNYIIQLVIFFSVVFMYSSADAQCIPTVTQAGSGDYINNFTLGSLSNLNSGENPNTYALYPQTGNYTLGQSYSYSIQTGSPTYAQSIGIWIDYNGNASFGDPGEFVYVSPTTVTSATTLTGTITISGSATPGIRRMRVCSKFNTAVAPTESCGITTFGEYEDYNIVIRSLTASCSATPGAGTAVAVNTNPCAGENTTVLLNGPFYSASNFGFQWYRSTNCTGTWTPISGVSNPSATTPILNVATVAGSIVGYRCVVTCINSGLTSTSTSACVTSPSWTCTTPCYGISTALNPTGQDIFNVTMGTLNNTTDCANPMTGSQGSGVGSANLYANFTNGVPQPTIIKGVPQTFSVTIGTCSTSFPSSIKIYIDYNHNASFLDAGEQVYSNTAIGNLLPSAVLTGTITPPISALNGCTRMRVIMASTSLGAIDPVGLYTWGETEDYSINLTVPGPYDPTITGIATPSGNGCLESNETLSATVCNYGTNPINMVINPVYVTYTVQGPAGNSVYIDTINSGTLQAFGVSCATSTVSPVNLYTGGNYSINAVVSCPTLTNGSISNDSLNNPINITTHRPIADAPYALCQNGSIPPGQGLSVSGCGTSNLDSMIINFTVTGPCIDNIGSTGSGDSPGLPSNCADEYACTFAHATLPALPSGPVYFVEGELTVTNLATGVTAYYQTLPNEVRMNLFGSSPTGGDLFSAGLEGSSINTANSNFTYQRTIPSAQLTSIFSSLSAGGTLHMGYWESFNDTFSASDILIDTNNSTTASLKIYFQSTPPTLWYDVPTGGTSVYNNSPFDPFSHANGLVSNSSIPGTYTFYAACSTDPTCRVPVDLIINSSPDITCTSNHDCYGNNAASINVTIANQITTLNITSPTPYQFNTVGAAFGPPISSNPLLGDILYYSNPDTGCVAYPPGTFAGKIALIDRGSCFFELKAFNAQNAGALGVIIVNNLPDPIFPPGAVNLYAINIPVVMISQADGQIIKNLLNPSCNTLPYSILWSNGSTTPTITSIPYDTYTVTVTAPGGCESTCSSWVANGLWPIISSQGMSDCNLTSGGSAGITIHNYPYTLYADAPFPAQADMRGALFGPDIETNSIAGDIFYYSNPDEGCVSYPPGTFAGKIALIDRGTCPFELKTFNAQNAGAIGVIITNNVPDPIFTMGAVNLYNITIPAIMISQSDGQSIKDALQFFPPFTVHTKSYSFLWNTGDTTASIFNLSPANYNLFMHDRNGCANLIDYNVTGPIQPPTISSIGKSTLCNDSVVLHSSDAGTAIQLNSLQYQAIDLNADITDLDNANFSIEAWIKTTGGDQDILFSGNNDSIWEPGERALYIDSFGNPIFVGYTNGYIQGLHVVNDGNWHHIAVTWDNFNNVGKMYVDGTDRTIYELYGGNTSPNIGTFSIGRPNYFHSFSTFDGEIDEVKIWNIARPQSDIMASMSNPQDLSAPGLRAYYKMDEGSGTMVIDQTSGYHGSLVNNPPYTPSGAFGYSFLWPTNETTSSINVTNPGLYDVTITTPLGCYAVSDPFTVGTTPPITASGPTSFCTGASVTLTADPLLSNQRFASGVIGFSSQFAPIPWGAIQVLGAPNVYPTYGDISGAWASGSPDDPREYLEVGFSNPAPIDYIDIYETHAPGAVDTVYVKNPNTGSFEVVYAGAATIEPPVSRIMHITFPTTAFPVSEIRIALNSQAVPSWNEIDAVAIGTSPNYLWTGGGNGSSIVVDSGGTYNVTVTYANGCSSTSNDIVVNEIPCGVSSNLKVFIEGYYAGAGLMTSVLYNQGVSLNTAIADTITIELHDENYPYGFIESTTAILMTDGTSFATFNSLSGSYYLAIKHRNGNYTWSAAPVTLGPIPSVYDFTTSSSQAYGNNLKEVSPGVWAVFSGDFNYDENIDLIDASILELDITNFEFGYFATDINGDGNVDLLDTPTIEDNIFNFIYSNHP